MGKKGGSGNSPEDVKREHPLQAIVLADSFTKTFRPITLERPKVLLPLVNVPMIEYTLENLAGSGVKEIFLFCCWHADLVEEYLQNSRWKDSTDPVVKAISFKTNNAGDALRELDSLGLIRSDPFLLLSGDVVSNVNLRPILETHVARRKKDKNCIMTVVFKHIPSTHGLRPLESDLVVAIDKDTKQMLRYEDDSECETITLLMDDSAEFHAKTELRYDLLDCHIDICSPEMLLQIADNYDYQDLRKDYIRREVQNHELGYQIFAHELVAATDYAARVHDLRTYNAISKDIIERWLYPLVPDNNWSNDEDTYTHTRGFSYQEAGVTVSRTCSISEGSVVGANTEIGDDCVITTSVIGKRCKIGKNVIIENSYLWNDVEISDNAVIRNSVLCDNCKVGTSSSVLRGCVIGFGVEIGPNFTLKEFSRITKSPIAVRERLDSDDEDEENADADTENRSTFENEEIVGKDGYGRVWNVEEDSDYDSDDCELPKWCRSVMNTSLGGPFARQSIGVTELEDIRSSLWEEMGDVASDSEDEEHEDPEHRFVRAVYDLLIAATVDASTIDNLVLEVNGLKFAQDRTFADCLFAMVPVIFRTLVDAAVSGKLNDQLIKSVVNTTSDLLSRFIMGKNDELALIEALEYFCQYGKQAGVIGITGSPVVGMDVIDQLEDNTYTALCSKFPVILLSLITVDLISQDGLELWFNHRTSETDPHRLKLFQMEITQQIVELYLGESSEEESGEESSEGESE